MRLTRGDAITAVLNALAPPDLAARYHYGMEVQVLVEQGHGELVNMDGPPMYSHQCDTWYSYRIDSAEKAAKPQTYNLGQYFDSIGISGHDPVRGVSVGVGFDFDSIVGHKIGLTNEQLETLLAALKQLPYVEIRCSTGGGGFHIWVWFDPSNLPQTMNRAEHKALARAVLQKMSLDCGHDFEADIDCYGGILWICARRATAENGGLTLVRPASEPLHDYPANWREHIDVIKGKRRRTKLHATLSDDDANAIDAEYQDSPRGLLDDEQQEFLDRLQEAGYCVSWNHDLGCATTHTGGIRAVQQQHGLKGIFETTTDDSEPDKPNCFMYPGLNGAWRVFRFNKDAQEAAIWEKSANGWTTCVINEPATLQKAAAAYGGVKAPLKTVEGYYFRDAEHVRKVIVAMGGKVTIPEFCQSRQLCIRVLDGKSVIVECEEEKGDELHADDAWKSGWTKDRKKWGVVVEVAPRNAESDKLPNTDSLVRHLVEHGEQAAIAVNTVQGWQLQNVDRARDYLMHRGLERSAVPYILGWCVAHPWEFVAIPFAEEFPGKRRWNRKGSKLLYTPAEKPGSTPHWDLILNHIGRGLDDAVEAEAWCKSHEIKTGADYLRRWIANLLRLPARRLPMLFMYSRPEQNTGKSVFGEAICQLIDQNGYTYGDKALTNASGFNGELRGAALCIVEETNLAKSDLAYTRLKAWVTAPTLQISPKGKDSFVERNHTHWVMTANNPDFLPIEARDTRVVMWEVTPFEGQEIDKDTLLGHLRKEAPAFLQQLFEFDLTDSAGRHTLPVLMTTEKASRIAKIEAATNSDGLPDAVRLLGEAIVKMSKPFSGTASQLSRALGDWSPEVAGKSDRSRETTIGRHMKRLPSTLAEQGITLTIESGRHTTYHLAG